MLSFSCSWHEVGKQQNVRKALQSPYIMSCNGIQLVLFEIVSEFLNSFAKLIIICVPTK